MHNQPDKLSHREKAIADRYAAGETYKEIAAALFIAPATVRNHLATIYRKLGVSGKPGLIKSLAADTSTDAGITAPGIGLSDQGPVRYCASRDGANIAHVQVGSGYPLLAVGSWMTHLEWDWDNPGWGQHLRELAQDFTLIRYDQRGNGMSDWDVDIRFDKFVDDLSSVIDCYDHDRLAILAPSQAAAVSIAYTVEHPERISHLILYGSYARGRRRRGDPDAEAESEALVTLIGQGWGRDNPAFRQTLTSLFMPDASQEQASWFNDFQKACGPAANIAKFREVFDQMDIVHLVDSVNVPTLVVHCVDDPVAPLSEGKFLASRIAGAQFVTLNSRSHMLLDNDPEFPRFLSSIRDFLASA